MAVFFCFGWGKRAVCVESFFVFFLWRVCLGDFLVDKGGMAVAMFDLWGQNTSLAIAENRDEHYI